MSKLRKKSLAVVVSSLLMGTSPVYACYLFADSFENSGVEFCKAPTAIKLSGNSVKENQAGAIIGKLTTTDPDGGTHIYSVDDGRFEVVGNQLKLKAGEALDYEAGKNVSLIITTIDNNGLSLKKSFTINVIDDPSDNMRYSKLSATGELLPDNATSWACVLDNETKIIWEKKTNDSNPLHGKNQKVPWTVAQKTLPNQFNDENFCGQIGWRLPTKKALATLIKKGSAPTIETKYFPNTLSEFYFSSTLNYSGTFVLGYSFKSGEPSPVPATSSTYPRAYRLMVKVTPLNDTGITWGGNYPWGSNSDCSGTEIAAQDCSHGRDAAALAGTLSKVGGGIAGFDFTKLDSSGKDLAATATSWSCVRDNVTGLMWEVKDGNGGLHDKDNTYSWYNTDSSNNGGDAGTQNGGTCNGGGDCDTVGFVTAVNTAGLCGQNDWRLPTREELRGIVDFSTTEPTIDTAYFPKTKNGRYWSSSPYANDGHSAWGVNFYYGKANDFGKGNSRYVRLVRGSSDH